MADDRSKGVVTRFNNQKGYGFIQPDEGGEDLFVHHSAVVSHGYRTLREGQPVEFTIILQNDKTKATNVTAPGGGPVDSAPPRRANSNGRGRNSGGGSGGGECFSCGEYGHIARDCNNGNGNGGRECYNCGGVGHMARECPSEARFGARGRNGSGGACFSCGQPGHLARDCGGGGYSSGNGGGGNCFNCGKSGHFARDCEEPRVIG